VPFLCLASSAATARDEGVRFGGGLREIGAMPQSSSMLSSSMCSRAHKKGAALQLVRARCKHEGSASRAYGGLLSFCGNNRQ